MRRLIFVIAIIALITITAPPAAIAQGKVTKATADDAVKHCLDVVHHFPADQMAAHFYKEFDAYFNPTTGMVEDNVFLNGQLPAQFEFRKCMAAQGLALGGGQKSR